MRILYLFVFLIVTSVTAQVTVGASQFGKFKDFRKGEYDALRGKTTLFVVDDLEVDVFKAMVKEVWTFNAYDVIPRSDYFAEAYKNNKYAPFVAEGFVRTVTSKSGMMTDYYYVYLHFYHYDIKKKKNKDKVKKRTMGGVFLSADGTTIRTTIATKTFGNLYEEYHNYGLGYLKNQLQLINRELEDDGYYWAYDSDENKKQLKKLKKMTLYVPDYLKGNMNAWTGEDGKKEDPDDLFKKYDHPYEWISKEMLNDKIMNASEEFFYLSWVRVNSQKFVNVINGLTGEIIYEDYEILAYNIKRNDITRLNTKIK